MEKKEEIKRLKKEKKYDNKICRRSQRTEIK